MRRKRGKPHQGRHHSGEMESLACSSPGLPGVSALPGDFANPLLSQPESTLAGGPWQEGAKPLQAGPQPAEGGPGLSALPVGSAHSL